MRALVCGNASKADLPPLHCRARAPCRQLTAAADMLQAREPGSRLVSGLWTVNMTCPGYPGCLQSLWQISSLDWLPKIIKCILFSHLKPSAATVAHYFHPEAALNLAEAFRSPNLFETKAVLIIIKQDGRNWSRGGGVGSILPYFHVPVSIPGLSDHPGRVPCIFARRWSDFWTGAGLSAACTREYFQFGFKSEVVAGWLFKARCLNCSFTWLNELLTPGWLGGDCEGSCHGIP